MKVDFNLVRKLMQQANDNSPFLISPELPFVDIKFDPLSISMDIPDDEGLELKHWRWLSENSLVRISHNNQTGVGKGNNRVDGLTSKGIELLELSKSENVWQAAVEICEKAESLILSSVISQLRRMARKRIATVRGKAE